MNKPFSTYNGGKAGSGTYQTIINLIPFHDEAYYLFLGNGGVESVIKPAKISVYNDIDPVVIKAWKEANHSEIFRFWCLDALMILRRMIEGYWIHCPSTTFIYLDPPYIIDSRKSPQKLYNFEMTVEQHTELLDIVNHPFWDASGVKIMLHCYPNSLYSSELSDWNKEVFTSQTRNGKALECLYYNYPAPVELHDYKFLGDNFRQREANNRIRNNIIKKLEALPVDLRNSILSDITSHFNAILQGLKA